MSARDREQELKELQESSKELVELAKEVPKELAKALPALAIKGFTTIVFLFLLSFVIYGFRSSPTAGVIAGGLLIIGLVVWVRVVEKVTGIKWDSGSNSGRRSGGQSGAPYSYSASDSSGFGSDGGGGACDSGGGGGGDGGGGGCDGGGGGD